MELWIPDQSGAEAIGELPDGVDCHRFPPAEPPQEIVGAEFLVASSAAREAFSELMARMPGLRVVQTLSAGVDWLPAMPPGVTVCDAAGARDAAVAEWILAAILSIVKGFPQLRDHQLAHRWEWSEHSDLEGSTVMILGYGSIGRTVEARLAPFDVEMVRVARHARAGVHAVTDLARLLPSVHVLVVLLPLTVETRGLLGAEQLALMRPGALLVNAARGQVIDTEAMLARLQDGRLRAALDVTDPEPLPPEHPLWEVPGAFISPHFAGDSPLADRRAFQLVAEQVRRYVSGEQLANIVTAGY